MSRAWLCSLGLAMMLLAAAPAAGDILRGSVSYRERIALPPDAVVAVRLIDAARRDVAAERLAELRQMAVAGPPFAFAVEVAPSWLEGAGRLVLQAEIEVAGRTWMRSTEAVPVDAVALAQGVEVRVSMAGEPAPSAAVTLDCRGNEPFWSLAIRGATAEVRTPDDEGWPQQATWHGTAARLDWADPAQVIWQGGPPLSAPLTAVAREEACRDTMADRAPYGWSVTVVGPGNSVRLGCCDAP